MLLDQCAEERMRVRFRSQVLKDLVAGERHILLIGTQVPAPPEPSPSSPFLLHVLRRKPLMKTTVAPHEASRRRPGPQGVGKNKLADRLLGALRLEREYIQLHRDTTVQSLTLQPSLQVPPASLGFYYLQCVLL